jgi:hypothetical protein
MLSKIVAVKGTIKNVFNTLAVDIDVNRHPPKCYFLRASVPLNLQLLLKKRLRLWSVRWWILPLVLSPLVDHSASAQSTGGSFR